MQPDVPYALLMHTDEGRAMLRRFAQSVGCDLDKMVENGEPGRIVDWIDLHHSELFCFLCAIKFAFQ